MFTFYPSASWACIAIDGEILKQVFDVDTKYSLMVTLLILVGKIVSANATLQSPWCCKGSASALWKRALVFC